MGIFELTEEASVNLRFGLLATQSTAFVFRGYFEVGLEMIRVAFAGVGVELRFLVHYFKIFVQALQIPSSGWLVLHELNRVAGVADFWLWEFPKLHGVLFFLPTLIALMRGGLLLYAWQEQVRIFRPIRRLALLFSKGGTHFARWTLT